MLIRKSWLEHVRNEEFENIPMAKFSVFSGIALSTLSLIKHDKRVISEKLYDKIDDHLTRFVKYSKIESERGGNNESNILA